MRFESTYRVLVFNDGQQINFLPIRVTDGVCNRRINAPIQFVLALLEPVLRQDDGSTTTTPTSPSLTSRPAAPNDCTNRSNVRLRATMAVLECHHHIGDETGKTLLFELQHVRR
jgi:hypothetical protein